MQEGWLLPRAFLHRNIFMELLVRPECAADYEVVADLLSTAFGRGDEAEFVSSLRKNEGFDPALSLVAEDGDGMVVGYLLLFPISHGGQKLLALFPVAIMPELQGEGAGNILVEEGLKNARSRGYSGVIVLGEEGFYPEFGFRSTKEWGIFSDVAGKRDSLIALELEAKSLHPGTVHFPTEYKLIH